MPRSKALFVPLLIYRALSVLIAIVQCLRGVWGVLRGRLSRADLNEMTLGGPGPTHATWFHAASLGEVRAARPVIMALLENGPVQVSVTTLSAKAEVQGWTAKDLHVSLCPVDLGWVTRRYLTRRAPRALIIVENELWPARIAACHTSGVPVALINARMSERSAKVWGWFPQLARHVLGPMALIAPQDANAAMRLEKLGARAERFTPVLNLKSLYTAQTRMIPEALAGIDKQNTILAASTHAGEDQIILQAFEIARETNPDLRLIIAPRHPARGNEVAKLIQTYGHDVHRRSLGHAPTGTIYLADTQGEMDLWYRSAACAFIGGSLVVKGGHTPFEPIAYDCPVITGPHVANFQDAYDRLCADGAVIMASDAPSLAQAYRNAANNDTQAQRARATTSHADPTDLIRKLRRIAGFLP